MSDSGYLHGFDPKEQARLRAQARFGENYVYRNIDLSRVSKLIEIGCGVGAQSEILLRRFPDLHLTGVDLSDKQVAAAKSFLSETDFFKDRYEILEVGGERMPFSAESFDGAFICWLLEHVDEPVNVLQEAHRILKSGSVVYITEVMNSSFFVDPYSPAVWKYWTAFNDYQFDKAGDPFVGAKLGNLLLRSGFTDIQTWPVTFHFDAREPGRRQEMIEYWTELLMSGADRIVKAGYCTQEESDLALSELRDLRDSKDSVFIYTFMQAKAIKR